MFQNADRPMRWEPRVLWDQVGVFDASGPTEVRLRRNHFRNGEDFPYLLTHMLIAPVGVPYRRGAGAPAASMATALSRARVWVQHPDVRKVSRVFEGATTFWAQQSGTPRPSTGDPLASSVFGNMAWMFERPVRVPPMVRLVVRMSGCRLPALAASDPAAPLVTPTFFQENPVNARVGPTRQLRYRFENGLPGIGAAQAAALGCAFNTSVSPDTVWSDDDFYRSRRQDPAFVGAEATEGSARRTGPSYLTGFNFHVNQLAIDGNMGAGIVNAPLGNTIGVSIGSSMGDPAIKRDSPWWRGKAPLSLVCPTINDIAIVHRLPDPIRLQRGQALDVAVELCRDGLTDQTIGVSFVGYTQQEA